MELVNTLSELTPTHPFRYKRLGKWSVFFLDLHLLLNLVCPRYNRESEEGRTFSVSATRLWNSLPIDLKKGTCVTSFRKAIYSHFLTRYNDVDHFSLSET